MRGAKPDELQEHALPILTARASEAELRRWFPVSFHEITDPWAAREPSVGGLLALNSGEHFVIYWGWDSGQLTVRVAPSIDASSFLSSFVREVPLPRSRITWLRNGVELPRWVQAIEPEPAKAGS